MRTARRRLPQSQSGRRKGFTIIELLLVIGIIAILASIVIIAINPAKQLAQARNVSRIKDAGQLVSAMHQYIIDEERFPAGIDGTLRMIGTDAAGCGVECVSGDTTAENCVDLSATLEGVYIVLPIDRKYGTAGKTYFATKKLPNNRIHVEACGSELGVEITVEQ